MRIYIRDFKIIRYPVRGYREIEVTSLQREMQSAKAFTKDSFHIYHFVQLSYSCIIESVSIDFVKSDGLYYLSDSSNEVVDGNHYPSNGLKRLYFDEAERYLKEYSSYISNETHLFYA